MSLKVLDQAEFKYPWRSYQQRVLADIETHLADEHIHVIAPPGSGKTVLGLEILRRISEPSLILAPTLAIRDQWQTRFEELFLKGPIPTETSDLEQPTPLFSNNLEKPGILTLATYQALHQALQKNKETILTALQNAKIGTLVVDEAHHLTKAWWNSLNSVKALLKPKVVGLTATPPYDVSWDEWRRYEELNGDIDAEISVPELIAEGDLCPHQDFIHLSLPEDSELEALEKARLKKEQTFQDILSDSTLEQIFLEHPFYTDIDSQNLKQFDHIEFYAALLIYLNHLGHDISVEHRKIIDHKKTKIPDLQDKQLEVLINYFITGSDSHCAKFSEEQESWANKLKQRGYISGKTFRWERNASQEKILAKSLNKIKSIEEIFDFEFQQLQNKLRMVILTDYIRKEYLAETTADTNPPKLGAVPLFEVIRQKCEKIKFSQASPALLTGSLVILPRNILADLSDTRLSLSAYPHSSEYSIVSHPAGTAYMVKLVTELFTQGKLQVVIGTHALLGEGWDAPAINALIMASHVGAHVTTNQMRGRAMRSQQNSPEKTANIWHLATIDPFASNGGAEINGLSRRFKSFVGVSYSPLTIDQTTAAGEPLAPRIQSGYSRLGFYPHQFSPQEIKQHNELTLNQAKARKTMANAWHQAVTTGGEMVEQLIKPYPEPGAYQEHRQLYFNKTLTYFFIEASAALVEFFWEFLWDLFETLIEYETPEDMSLFLQLSLLTFMLTVAPKFLRYFYLTLKYRDISKDIHRMAIALLDTLIAEKLIRSPVDQIEIHHEVDDAGAISLYLTGTSRQENNLFLSNMEELLEPIQNPRYLLTRLNKSSQRFHRLLDWIKQKDYHAVPEKLGKKQQSASTLRNHWRQQLGGGELIYTRTPDGRKMLIKARYEALSAQFSADELERQDMWR